MPPVWRASGGPAADESPEAFAGPVTLESGPIRPRKSDRGLIITLLISIGLHVVAATALLLLLHAGIPAEAPEKLAEVELVMDEHAGDKRPDAAPASAPPAAPKSEPDAEAKAEQSRSEKPAAVEAPAPSPPTPPPVDARPEVAEETTEPVRKSDPSPAAAENPPAAPPVPVKEVEPAKGSPEGQVQDARSAPKPEPPVSQPVPTITLHGTDSPSDARAWGDRILPAAPDAVFHNRPPAYPREASANRQRGTVVVMIHISPSGQAAGADVVNSSGYVLLDSAARDAVMHWRFLPAVKDGQPIASEMKMVFVFDFD